MAVDLVLVPGHLCTGALWEPQIAALGDIARITVADHTRHDSMEAIAAAILKAAPPKFALAGLSMGGYIAYAIIRQAPERVTRLALLDTGSRADAPDRREQRLALRALAEREGTRKAQEQLLPVLIHTSRLGDKPLVETVLRMGEDTGLEAFKRQQAAQDEAGHGAVIPEFRASEISGTQGRAVRCPWPDSRCAASWMTITRWRRRAA